MSGLNALVVPMYMIRATERTLVRLAGTSARKDLRPELMEARGLARSYERLRAHQAAPTGERIVAKEKLTKSPLRPGGYDRRGRTRSFSEMETKVREVFRRLDKEAQGKARFTLILTFTDG